MGMRLGIRRIGPFAYAGGKENLPHPDVPAPFRNDFGAIDGSFGPLRKLLPEEKLTWRTGGWRKQREMRYESDDDRDSTGDELNAQWAVKRLKEIAADPEAKPFFMGVGFVPTHAIDCTAEVFRPVPPRIHRTARHPAR